MGGFDKNFAILTKKFSSLYLIRTKGMELMDKHGMTKPRKALPADGIGVRDYPCKHRVLTSKCDACKNCAIRHYQCRGALFHVPSSRCH